MAPAKDPFAEFKGKQKLTEREVKLLLRRLNSGMIKASQLRRGGYALTPDQGRAEEQPVRVPGGGNPGDLQDDPAGRCRGYQFLPRHSPVLRAGL